MFQGREKLKSVVNQEDGTILKVEAVPTKSPPSQLVHAAKPTDGLIKSKSGQDNSF